MSTTQIGPFRASQIGDGDPYELSDGHAIQCMPARADHAESNLTGGTALETDPDVEWAGVDVGYSPDEGNLRAADLGLGERPKERRGWAKKAPRLVVEVAGVGQDEEALQEKIEEFFAAGTEVVWVVRLLGPHRVEVYEPDKPVAIRNADEELTAPGILQGRRRPAAVADPVGQRCNGRRELPRTHVTPLAGWTKPPSIVLAVQKQSSVSV